MGIGGARNMNVRSHCCEQMHEHLIAICPVHPNRRDCPDAIVAETDGSFSLIVHDGGSSMISIRFCPWCGADLTGILARYIAPPIRARVIGVPPGLPVDDLDTQGLFEACLGKSFDVIGRIGDLIELAVGEMRGKAPHIHSIWIEEDYTDLSFGQFRMSDKMLLFVIEAIEYRIAAYTCTIEDPATSEDDASDASNDRGVLMTAREYLSGGGT